MTRGEVAARFTLGCRETNWCRDYVPSRGSRTAPAGGESGRGGPSPVTVRPSSAVPVKVWAKVTAVPGPSWSSLWQAQVELGLGFKVLGPALASFRVSSWGSRSAQSTEPALPLPLLRVLFAALLQPSSFPLCTAGPPGFPPLAGSKHLRPRGIFTRGRKMSPL